MVDTLRTDLAIGSRELVAFTGGGGKTTLLLQLAGELASLGSVLVTTTTKLGIDQIEADATAWSIEDVSSMVAGSPDRPVFLFVEHDDHKVRGPDGHSIGRLFDSGVADYVLVEADGSRGRPLKVPAEHEPVVPDRATLVVVVAGIDAIGAPYSLGAHRPDAAAALTGSSVDDPITVEAMAAVLTSPVGGLKGVPPTARVVVAISKVGEDTADDAERVRARVEESPRVQGVVLVPARAG